MTSPAASRLEKLRGVVDVARFVLPYAWTTNRGASAVFAASTALSAVVTPLLTVVAGLVVTDLQRSMASSAERMSGLSYWLTVAGASAFLGVAAGAVRSYCRNRLIDDVNLRVNREMMHKAAALDLPQLENHGVQSLYLRSSANPHGNVIQASLGVLDVVAAAVQTFSLVAILFVLEPFWSAFLLLVAIPPLVHRWALSKAHHAAQREASHALRWAGYYAATLVNAALAPTVKILGLSGLFLKRFDRHSSEVVRVTARNHRRRAVASVLSAGVSIAVMLGMIAAVARRVMTGEIGVGAFVAYWAAAWRLQAAMVEFSEALSTVFDSFLVVSNLRRFLSQTASLPAGTTLHDGLPWRIELRGVTFQYEGAAAPAVDRVDLTIRAGETIAIVGSNGAGKSTLAKLLCRLYDVTEGQVLVNGVDVREYDPGSLRSQIAYVQQQVSRLEGTAGENLAFGDWSELIERPDKVEELAREFGIDELVSTLPQGYSTHLGRIFGEHDLSGGQWQRVAIARALFRTQASVVILDEPTASLDQKNEDRLYQTIKSQLREKTSILVTHHLSTIRLADRIVMMHQGRIVEVGTHAELLENDGAYAAMYRKHVHRLTAVGLAETNAADSERNAA